MARRRSKDNGAGIFLLILVGIVATLIVLATVFGVLALFGMWIWYEVQALEARKTPFGDVVTMTPAEQQAIAQANADVATYLAEMQQIEQQGSSLTRRSDGLFNERSNLGKQLNRELERVSLLLASASEAHDDAVSAPLNRLAAYKNAVTNCSALRLAVLAGVGVFLFTTQGVYTGLDDFGEWIGNATFIDILPNQHRYYGHIVIAFLASLAVWALSKPVFSWKVEQRAVALGSVP